MSPQWFERLTLTELRFPPQLPPGALNPTGHSTSAVHGVIAAGAVTCWAAESQEGFDEMPSVGVELGDVHLALENDGVEKFQGSWGLLMKAAQTQLGAAVWSQQSCSAITFGRMSQ